VVVLLTPFRCERHGMLMAVTATCRGFGGASHAALTSTPLQVYA
jgi:hypothetical protein